MAEYSCEVLVQTGREEMFDFFLKPENVREITLPDLNLTFVNAPETVAVGSRIEFEVTHIGQSLKAEHEVTQAGDFCIEECQVAGTLKAWRHRRTFEEGPGGACRIVNAIEFEPPGGLVGVIMNEDRIRANLDKGFDYQNGELRERFGEVTE